MNLIITDTSADTDNTNSFINTVTTGDNVKMGKNVVGLPKTPVPFKRNNIIMDIITEPTKKPPVTYDDILASLNMSVINGKLQIVRTTSQKPNIFPPNKNNPVAKYINKTAITEKPIVQKNTSWLPRSSYTGTNNYVDQNKDKDLEPVITKQEYKKLAAIQYLQQLAQQRRISETKSKKMLFANSLNNINIAPMGQNNNLNHLFNIMGK